MGPYQGLSCNTKTFLVKLRKARIDAGLMINDLAKILGVTQDTGIHSELRGISPSSQNLKSVENVLAKFGSSRIRNQASFRIE
jgi:DNA-binding XRE family transcriptional regulator